MFMTNTGDGMDRYIERDGKKMRYGYTTGSSAAAASKAAVMALFTGETTDYMTIDTPKGWQLSIEVIHLHRSKREATSYVVKDGGDDPDVTHGIKVFATAMPTTTGRIEIEGGIGVGRVTLKGLRVPVGHAAINPVPLEMIRTEVAKVLPQGKGVNIVIFIPEGVEVAKKTFNPKLGIIGGISVLGTSGIVEPMSEDAFKASLKVELSVLRAKGRKKLFFVFGNFGRDYLGKAVPEDKIQKTSNFVAYMLQAASDLGFEEILYIGHAGKMVKVAAGMTNTHSKHGDHRMTSLADCGKAIGLGSEGRGSLLKANTTDEAVEILDNYQKRDKVFEEVANRCKTQCEKMAGNRLKVECLVFTTIYGTLAKSSGVDRLMKEIKG